MTIHTMVWSESWRSRYRPLMRSPTFEWDPAKDVVNRLKHGVSFARAQRAFADPRRVIAEDDVHGLGERRFFCIGLVDHAVLTVRFTWRGGVIRIFGAGYWRKGKSIYERANQVH